MMADTAGLPWLRPAGPDELSPGRPRAAGDLAARPTPAAWTRPAWPTSRRPSPMRDDLAGAVVGDADTALPGLRRRHRPGRPRSPWRGDPEGFRAAARAACGPRWTGCASQVTLLAPADGTYSLGSSDAPLVLTVRNDLPVRRPGAARPAAPAATAGCRSPTSASQTLAPGQRTTLQVPTQVRQSGGFAVTAQLTTPGGGPLGDRIAAAGQEHRLRPDLAAHHHRRRRRCSGCCSCAGWSTSCSAAAAARRPREPGAPEGTPARCRPPGARCETGPSDDRRSAADRATRPARRRDATARRRRRTAMPPPPPPRRPRARRAAAGPTPRRRCPPPPVPRGPAAVGALRRPRPVAAAAPGPAAAAAPPLPPAAARRPRDRWVPAADDTQVMTSLPPVPRGPVDEREEDVEAPRGRARAPAAASCGRPGRWRWRRWSPGSPGCSAPWCWPPRSASPWSATPTTRPTRCRTSSTSCCWAAS